MGRAAEPRDRQQRAKGMAAGLRRTACGAFLGLLALLCSAAPGLTAAPASPAPPLDTANKTPAAGSGTVLPGSAAGAAASPLCAGTSGDYPPFSSAAAGGELQGFDIDLLRRLGQDLGRPVDLVLFRWPNLRSDLAGGSFELAASGITIRPDRLLVGSFSRPYAVSRTLILIRATDRLRFAAGRDLDTAGARLGVNRGGYLESVVRAAFRRAQIVPIDDNTSLGLRLRRGEVDAVVSDSMEAPHFLAAGGLMTLAELGRARKAILVRRGDSQLRDAVDRWLAAREEDGWLDGLRRLHLGTTGDLSPAQRRVEALVSLIEQRLGLMPWIAAAKRLHQLPIEDRAQENRVLEHTRTAARAAGLDPRAVADLFAEMIEDAKQIQRAAPPVATAADLESLRRVVAELSGRLVAELAAARPLAGAAQLGSDIEASLSGADIPGLDAPARRRLAAAIAAALHRPS